MRIRFVFILILLISITIPINARAAEENIPTFRQQDIIPGELIVIMQAGNSVRSLTLPEETRASTKKRGGLGKLNAGVINVPAGEEGKYIAELRKGKGVLNVEPNYRVSANMIPADPLYSLQYAPNLIQAESAWDVTTGASGVTIAIIDSGIDSSHPEFAGRIAPGYDFIQNDTDPQDECGHGTHVAGIAAAAGNNGQGIAGIAWGAQIMPLRALDANCGGSFADIAEALVWAADHGADIINLSVGSSSPSTLMENASYYAYSHGVAVFAASGNSGASSVLYPAAYPWVMAVGSVDSASARVISSNYGSALDLMAPGNLIYSTLPMYSGFLYNTFGYSTQYDYLSGTSMASPHVAGAAALLASMPCFDTPDKIYQAMTATALNLGAPGRDNLTGYGLIQIADALTQCPPSQPPPATFATQYDLVRSSRCGNLVKYKWRDANDPYVSPGNSSYTNISLPFPFDYAGVSYASINAHANGFISLGNNNTSIFTEGNYQNNDFVPGIALPNNFLAPFWDDLRDAGGADSGIYTAALGVAPNREFVIEYRGFERADVNGSSLNFEVVLFETSNEILFQYKTLTGAGTDGSSATVGVEYGNGLGAQQYSYNQSDALYRGLALLFIPYASGSSSLPSSACPRSKAISIAAGAAQACDTAPATFDVDIAAGILSHLSNLKVQQLSSAPAMPQQFFDLHHYADINLNYAPPAPSLSPMPAVYVCYQYTPQDVLAAGGHAKNLFIAAHDISTNKWSALPTSVDKINSRILALAPHFSYYGVATLNTIVNDKSELGLPVTGEPISGEFAIFIIFVCIIFLSNRIWLSRSRKAK